MPRILKKNIENGEIGIWNISEELGQLEQFARLSDQDLLTFSGISALHRKKEWLATRVLLNEMLNKPSQINYYNDGKPYLENGEFNISISHTTGFIAILLHKHLIPGIDIELLNRHAEKVASRFLSTEEYEFCRDRTGFSNRKLILHWCAKEAIFKMMPFSQIEFSSDILISLDDTSNDSGSFRGIFRHKSGQIPVLLEFNEGNGTILVWGCTTEVK